MDIMLKQSHTKGQGLNKRLRNEINQIVNFLLEDKKVNPNDNKRDGDNRGLYICMLEDQ